MIHAEYRYSLPVSPGTLFDYIADPARDAEWQASCLASQLIDADRPAVGVRYRIAFSFMGRRSEFVGRITEREPASEYAFEVVEGPFTYRGRYSLTPSGGDVCGVDVHWQFWAEPARFFGIIPASLLRKVLVSQVEKDVVGLRERFARQPA